MDREHPRSGHDKRDEIELSLRDAYAAGCNSISGGQIRSYVTAAEYAAREAPKLREKLQASTDCDTTPTIDLDAEAWQSIKQAASESKWIPPEYYANDWHSDVCRFLREGIADFVPRADELERALAARPATVPEGWRERLQRIASALNGTLGDTDPYFPDGTTDENIRDEEPVWWAARELNIMLAAAPQPDHSASAVKMVTAEDQSILDGVKAMTNVLRATDKPPSFACALWLVNTAAAVNAGKMTIKLDGVTDGDNEVGDWFVTVSKELPKPDGEQPEAAKCECPTSCAEACASIRVRPGMACDCKCHQPQPEAQAGACTCDGATYAPEQQHPFIVNRACPRHGEQPKPAEGAAVDEAIPNAETIRAILQMRRYLRNRDTTKFDAALAEFPQQDVSRIAYDDALYVASAQFKKHFEESYSATGLPHITAPMPATGGGEAVGVVCLTPDPYAHGSMVELQVQLAPGAKVERSMTLYAEAPPAVGKDEGPSWAEYWIAQGRNDIAHDFEQFERVNAWMEARRLAGGEGA